MKRGVLVVVLVVAIGAGATYVWRVRQSGTPTPSTAQVETESPMPSSAGEPPRADVTIDARRQQLIGVRLAPVRRTTIGPTVRAPGVVRYDETRQTDVNVKVEGWIRDLDVDFTGQPVRRGQRLFTFYSPELLAAQNEFIFALRNRDQAASSAMTDAPEYASRLVDASRQRLALWDPSADEVRQIESTRTAIAAIAVVAPTTGFVAEKQAVRGMHITPGQTLYKIADLAVIWVEADIYEQDISLVRLGQAATVTVDSYPGAPISGHVVYVYPDVNTQTRTAKVRIQLANPAGRLKPGMFANVELRGPEHEGLTVPVAAVLDAGAQQTVFVAEGEGRFTPRRVRVGRRLTDAVEILEGLKEGEQVADAATFFLDSESQLRAGLESYETPVPPNTPTTAGASVDIAFRPMADPPRTGDNTFEVTVKARSGSPIADADVAVTLFMPAMPTMNMPAMRNEFRLPSAGGGLYRGVGQLMTGGRWEATVTVSRDGQRLGSKQFIVVAR